MMRIHATILSYHPLISWEITLVKRKENEAATSSETVFSKDLCNVTLFYPDISMYEKTNWNAFKNKDLGEFMKQKRKYTLQPKTFYQKMKYMVFL